MKIVLYPFHRQHTKDEKPISTSSNEAYGTAVLNSPGMNITSNEAYGIMEQGNRGLTLRTLAHSGNVMELNPAHTPLPSLNEKEAVYEIVFGEL